MYITEKNPTEDPRIQKTFGSNPKGQIERSNKQKISAMENFEQNDFENNLINYQQRTQQILEDQLDMTNDQTIYAVNNFYADLSIGEVHAMVGNSTVNGHDFDPR